MDEEKDISKNISRSASDLGIPSPVSETEAPTSPSHISQTGARPQHNEPNIERKMFLQSISLPNTSSQRRAETVGTQKTPEEIADEVRRTLTEKGIPLAAKAPEEVSAPAPEKKSSGVSQIRTFKSDVAQTIEKKKTSLIDVVAKEQERRAETFVEPQAPSPLIQSALGIGIALFALSGAILLGYVAILSTQKPEVSVVAETPLVFSEDQQEKILGTVDRTAIMTVLTAEETKAALPLDSIRDIRLMRAKAAGEGFERLSAPLFFAGIEANVESSFLRTLEDRMMIGVYSFGYTLPFMILKTRSYDQAFGGMLAWEARMPKDLDPFFPNTFGEDRALFSDAIVENKDVRILKNSAGNLVLLYSFVDKNTLIITNSEDALKELITRLGNTRSVGG